VVRNFATSVEKRTVPKIYSLLSLF